MSVLPSANLHLRELYDTTVEFFALRSPGILSRATSSHDIDSPTSHSRTLTPVPDPIAKLTRECASLRERLDQANGRQGCLTSSSSSWSSTNLLAPMCIRRELLEDARRELSQTKTELSKLETRCRMLEKTLKETKALLKARDAEISKSRSSSQKRGAAGSESGSRASGDAQISVLPADENRALVKSTEVFMTRIDSWSGAQVLQAVQDLNSEILQFAAAATELSTFDKRSPSSKSTNQAVQETASRLGPNLARILSSRDHSADPMLVQLALQGCISICATRAWLPFCMGFPSKPDGILTQIYAHMFMAEAQPVSSRWRALTHRHIHTMYPYLNDYSVNELSETMFRWSSDILFIAGCPTSDRHALSTRDGMRAQFGDQIKRISRTVSHLAQVTREEIMSTRFELIAVENDGGFDSRRMTDAFGEYGSSRGAILITTEVGLRCTTRKDVSDSTLEGNIPAPEVEQRLLLPPKVVLDSVVDLIDK